MSTVMIVAPVVIANWSLISAAVGAAVAAAGFSAVAGTAAGVAQGLASRNVTREEIDVPDSEILGAAAGTGERIVAEKDGMRAIFSRDARGALKVCMEGEGVSKEQLRRVGEELVGRVTQQYVYDRLMTELAARNVAVIAEEVTDDAAVKIRVRSW